MPSSSLSKTSAHYADLQTNMRSSTKTNSKRYKHKYYPSNLKTGNIVNAITGEPYNWKNGTIDSLRLFRVIDSSGKCDKDGFYDTMGNHDTTFNKEPNVLFYDGPNEYMNHRNVKVNPMLVNTWNDSRSKLFANGELNNTAYYTLTESGIIKAKKK